MNAAEVVKRLEQARKGGRNSAYEGLQALENVKPGMDPKLVDAVIRKVMAEEWSLKHCRKLPEPFAATALKTVRSASTVQRLFLDEAARKGESPADQLHRTATWIFDLIQVREGPKAAAQLEKLTSDPLHVAAAQAVVAKFGADAHRMLMVLAWDGSDTSVDILLPVIEKALTGTDDTIVALKDLVVPFARGPRMKPMLELIARAGDPRGDADEFATLMAQLALPPQKAELELRLQLEAKLNGWPQTLGVWLRSRTKPRVQADVYRFGARDGTHVHSVADGKVVENELKMPKLEGLLDLPGWVSKTGKKLGVRWKLPKTIRSSLKRAERQRLLDWLMGG
jgi:hypothetical protein